jgi:hypothetical protein
MIKATRLVRSSFTAQCGTSAGVGELGRQTSTTVNAADGNFCEPCLRLNGDPAIGECALVIRRAMDYDRENALASAHPS